MVVVVVVAVVVVVVVVVVGVKRMGRGQWGRGGEGCVNGSSDPMGRTAHDRQHLLLPPLPQVALVAPNEAQRAAALTRAFNREAPLPIFPLDRTVMPEVCVGGWWGQCVWEGLVLG